MATYTNVGGVLECVGTDITSTGIYDAIMADGTLGTASSTQSGAKYQFYFNANISIGSAGSIGLNSIWDCSSQEVSIEAGFLRVYGVIKLGNQNDGYSASGGAFSVAMANDQFRLYSGGKFLAYGSYVYAQHRIRIDGNNEWVTEDCDFEPEDGVSLSDGWTATNSTVSYKNSRVHHTGAVGIKLYGDASNSFNLHNVKVEKCTYAFQLDGNPKTVKNVKIDSCTNHTVPNQGDANITFINPDFLILRQAASNSNDKASIEFEYNLVVKDSFGSNLSDVRMYLVDEQGVVRSNVLTDVSGAPVGLTTFKHSTWAGNTPTPRANHTVKYRKYSYLFSGGSRNAVANNNETTRLSTNNMVGLTETNAGLITGVSIDGVAKTITVSQAIATSDLYDYSQWWAVQSSNIQYDEALLTNDGNNYQLNTGWKLVLDNEVNGGINLTGNVELSSVVNLTSHNINGSVTFAVAGTYTFTDCIVGEVVNTSGGAVTLNASGTTSIGINAGPNIVIVAGLKTMTFTGLQVGSDVVLLEAGTSNIIDSVDQVTGTTWSYVYTASVDFDYGVIKAGYVTIYRYGLTMASSDGEIPIKQLVDRNYQ